MSDSDPSTLTDDEQRALDSLLDANAARNVMQKLHAKHDGELDVQPLMEAVEALDAFRVEAAVAANRESYVMDVMPEDHPAYPAPDEET